MMYTAALDEDIDAKNIFYARINMNINKLND